MPLYDFECTNEYCEEYEKPFERLLSIKEAGDLLCVLCGKPVKKKVGKSAKHPSWGLWRVQQEAGRKVEYN